MDVSVGVGVGVFVEVGVGVWVEAGVGVFVEVGVWVAVLLGISSSSTPQAARMKAQMDAKANLRNERRERFSGDLCVLIFCLLVYGVALLYTAFFV